ncbi:beta-amyrin 16-alpha-hydroxylase CYP87D16-like isoform X2 [Hevea brasiliensis]|nr:beta-amyrin 16-alpha-hydroxylase CYP87D16-like isoform X2 [Hevea brasiliensis]
MLTIGLVLVALLVIYVTYWVNKWRNPKCTGVLPPGSMGFPLIGESLQLLIPSYSFDLHPFIKKRIQRYGPIFRSNVAGRPIVFSADPELNHYILSQERRSVELWYLDAFSNLFVLEGESRTSGATASIHKYIRSLFLTHFGSERLKGKLLPLIEDLIRTNLRSWSSQATIEVKHCASALVCDFTAKLLFGYDAEKSSFKMSEKFERFAESFAAFPFNIPGTAYHRSIENRKKLTTFLERVLRERKSSAEKSEEDILNQTLDDMEKEEFITDEFIIQILFGGLFAIAESIPITITLLFKFLSAHPSVLEELTNEQEKILKNRKGSDSPSITWDDYKSMTFTIQVINETLRMGNIAPGLLRRTIRDVHYKGYTIPASWTIMLLTSASNLNPELYKDPLEFNPWRWKDLDSQTISKSFTPFGGGTRQCAGADFSRVFISIFLHVLVTKYR